jgi:hypothetical protein
MIGILSSAILGGAALITPAQAQTALYYAQQTGDLNAMQYLTKILTIISIRVSSAEISPQEIPPKTEAPISSQVAKAAPTENLMVQNLHHETPYILESIISPLTEEISHSARQKKYYHETRDFAQQSQRIVGDKPTALGMHIKAWHLARKHKLREQLTEIVIECQKQRHKTGYAQGKMFSALVRQLFEKHGIYTISEERLAIRAQLAEHLGSYAQ